jgi:hypothetical protein
MHLNPALATLLSILLALKLAVTRDSSSCANISAEWTCDRFQSWNELNEMFSNASFAKLKPSINIHPSAPIALTSELDLVDLLEDLNVKKSKKNKLIVNFIGINGIDVTPWSNEIDTSADLPLYISFENSEIKFSINGSDDIKCSPDLILPPRSTINETIITPTLFNIFSVVIFANNNKYPSETVCPYLFAYSKLKKLKILGQLRSVLINNLWEFTSIETNRSTISSSVQELEVKGFGFSLDTSLMHPLVFRDVHEVEIFRSIDSIQTDIFNYFIQTDTVTISMDNLKNFFHKIGIAWTQSLPLANSPWITFSQFKDIFSSWISGNQYAYPDEDFCLFAQYQQQVDLTFILNTNLTECTNTVRWLMFNYFNHDMSDVFAQNNNSERIFSICKASNQTWDFKNFTLKCNSTHDKGSTAIYA